MSLPSTTTLGLLASLLLIVGYLLYRASFPTPIPGIPYIKASGCRPFGDIPDALKYHAETKELISLLRKKTVELNSPIIQVFMRPFSKPWVVLADSQESQDIMARRTREFDRSEFFVDLFVAVAPHNQVTMRTNEQWRDNRRLMADTMAPKFLSQVAGPHVHEMLSRLTELWQTKLRLAQGHPFDAHEDIENVMLESIYAITFGSSLGALKAQIQATSAVNRLDSLSDDVDTVASFPHVARPELFEALAAIGASGVIPLSSPLGRYHHYFATWFYPSLRTAISKKNRYVRWKLDEAWQRFNRPDATESDVKCAADLIVNREVLMAKKQRRKPDYCNKYVQNELFGFVMAGSETTHTTVSWGLKFLSKHQRAQARLRESLYQAFPEAKSKGTVPTASDIAKAQAPYLDAVIEEISRCGGTASANMRVATEDTEILGYHIPKGTDVFMLAQGPSYTASAFEINQERRSKTSQQGLENTWTSQWETSTLGDFLPERWLVKNGKGDLEFDPRAGPMHTFGAGLRSCFGRRLAQLGMRIIFTSIIWNFELQPLPEGLADFKAQDGITHAPQQTHVRLAKVMT